MWSQGQSLSRSAVQSAAAQVQVGTVSVSYSIGEPVVSTLGAGVALTQGFQQPERKACSPVQVNQNASICQGQSYTLPSGNAVSVAGTYTSALRSAAGCDSVITTQLSVSPLLTPQVSISASVSGPVLPNTSIVFSATAQNAGSNPQYTWRRNGLVVGNNSQTYTASTWTDQDSVTCQLVSSATCASPQSVYSNRLLIQVPPQPKNLFLVVDVFQNRACYYDTAFSFVGSSTMSGTVLYGQTNAADVGTVNGYAYVLDGVNRCVYRSSAPQTVSLRSKTLRSNTGTALSVPTGLAISGDTLWVLDRKSKAIFRYSLSAAFNGSGTLNAAAKINLSSTNTTGESLLNSGSFLYVLDNGSTKVIWRYTKSNNTATRSRNMATHTGAALGTLTGITAFNGLFYVTDRATDKVYTYLPANLYSGSGTLNALSIYQLNTINLDATGITTTTSSSLLREDGLSDAGITDPGQLKVYPNPTGNTLQVEYEAAGQALLELFTLSGQCVYRYRSDEQLSGLQRHEIQLRSLGIAPGMYLMRLNTASQSREAKVILISE
jgi:hypothetical protein